MLLDRVNKLVIRIREDTGVECDSLTFSETVEHIPNMKWVMLLKDKDSFKRVVSKLTVEECLQSDKDLEAVSYNFNTIEICFDTED